MYSYQFYLWSFGRYTLSAVYRTKAATYEDAAWVALGKHVASAGPLHSLRLKVWPTGKAKSSEDVRRYWVADQQ